MDKKDKILKAATKIFAKEGYENTSVDKIVNEADVAKGTFYYYFKTKEDLFLDLIGTGTDKLSEQMVIEANRYSSPIQKVEAIIKSQYKFFDNNKDLCRVLLSEIWHFESKWKQKYDTKRDKYVYAMKYAIESGQKAGDFDDELDAKAASIAIFGMVATSALDQAVSGEPYTNKTVEIVTVIATHGLIK